MRIKGEDAWRTGSRNAMTLLKGQRFRVVLVAMHAGAVIPSHRADGPISLQVIEGALTFSADAQIVMLRPGQLLTLHAGMSHVVEAIEESVFLLTLATATEHSAES
jgi:quercetin dioxygenase-like cupin family protein